MFADDDDIINSANLALVLNITVSNELKDVYFCDASIESDSQTRPRYDLEILKGSRDSILKSYLSNKVDPTVMFNLFRLEFLKNSEVKFRSGIHEDVDLLLKFC